MRHLMAATLAAAGFLSVGAATTPGLVAWLDSSSTQAMCDVLSQAPQGEEYAALLKEAQISLVEGIALGLKEAKEGIVYKAEVEGDKAVHWAIDVSQGTKVMAVDIAVKTGQVVGTELENTDESKLARSAKITLVAAIESALQKTPGRAVSAEFKLVEDKPQAWIKILTEGNKLKSVKVDAETGKLLKSKAPAKAAPKAEAGFTDSFPSEEGAWSSTGRNPYFILEPGHFLILEGKEGGQDVRMEITVLDETKMIAGVETRVVLDRVTKNGQLAEIARDYYAFSKKTSSVYYFGEDVDNYKDGKIANHDGSWIAGEKGARYGLQTPGVPLLGARFYQEVAPGVGMDRIQIVSLSETVGTPAGRFEHCMKTEETSPLEPGVVDYKLYAPGIGLVKEGGFELVKYGHSTR